MTDLHGEVLLAATYAVFLLVVAAGLELAARHSHRRSERMRVAGFRYAAGPDHWICPNNEKLLRAEIDYRRGAVYYRAAAHACNRCAMKSRCTDSDEGRVIEHRPDSWLDSELRRFHRGISLTLIVLAALILTAEFVRHGAQRERLLTGGTLLLVAACGLRLAGGVAGRPAGSGPRASEAESVRTSLTAIRRQAGREGGVAERARPEAAIRNPPDPARSPGGPGPRRFRRVRSPAGPGRRAYRDSADCPRCGRSAATA
jgi:hypothetical protein